MDNETRPGAGIYDIIIIGGGPAGLTAGIYASRARLKTLLVESLCVASQAVIADKIENFPGFPEGISGFELVDKLKSQARQFGLEFVSGEVESVTRGPVFSVRLDGVTYEALSVIVAAGSSPKPLGVPGEEKFKGRGVSYCAVCDGALYRGKKVAVVGGGDTAAQEALFLTKFASEVVLIHRRDKLRAARILHERIAANGKITVAWDSIVTGISGDKRVSGVEMKSVRTGAESELSCDGVFIFVGNTPNTAFLKGAVSMDEKGYIIADDDMKTSVEGLFSCGDCRRKSFRQIVTACGDGATAAFSAEHYTEESKNTRPQAI
jgi:thioredoxin reductase (NADPH)